MRHRSLIAVLGSSPLGELFYACVSDGSGAYQVSVLSGVVLPHDGVKKRRRRNVKYAVVAIPGITAAPVPTRSPSPLS